MAVDVQAREHGLVARDGPGADVEQALVFTCDEPAPGAFAHLVGQERDGQPHGRRAAAGDDAKIGLVSGIVTDHELHGT